jgi:hypothetical protein
MTVSALTGTTTPGADFRSLQEVVDARPRSGTTLVADNLDFISALGEPAGMTSRLRALIADPAALAVIAERSYRHVNHFDKIVLVDSGDLAGYRLTLHLWDPPYTEAEIRDELIHDHRFSFWSNILTGELVSENFDRAEAGEGVRFQQYRYVPEKLAESTQSNFYQFVGDAPLVRTEPARELAGRSYYLYYERIHRVVLPTEHMTCTAVLRGPRERNHSNVYNTVYPDQDVRAQNRMFSATELQAKLSKLVSTIERTRLT